MLMPPPPHATQVCSQEYLDRLLAEGHERGYCVLEAVGMCFLAEDMDGWTQEYRTFCIELVRALLAYNILGDQLYLRNPINIEREVGNNCIGTLGPTTLTIGNTLEH